MRNFIATVALFLSIFSVAKADLALTWYDLSGKLYDHDGTEVSTSASWVFQLIADDSRNTTVGAMISGGQWQLGLEVVGPDLNNASDDRVVGSVSTWDAANALVQGWQDGTTTDISETYASDRFYFRFFNTDGSYAGIIYNTANLWVLPVDNASTVADANLSVGTENISGTQVLGSTDGWGATIPVPEPQTWGLMVMGLGIIMIAARKKFVK